MTTTVETLNNALQAKLQATMETAKASAQEAVLNARLRLLDSEAYQNALISQVQTTHKHELLQLMIEECQAVVSQMPVYDKVRKQDKKFNGRPTFGLGKDIELLHTLATGILFSVNEHKELMLAATGLNITTIEQFVEAMGNTAYWSDNNHTVVEEVPYNLPQLLNSVMLLGEQLGLVLDTNKLTVAVLDKRFTLARLQAENAQLEAEALPQDIHFVMA